MSTWGLFWYWFLDGLFRQSFVPQKRYLSEPIWKHFRINLNLTFCVLGLVSHDMLNWGLFRYRILEVSIGGFISTANWSRKCCVPRSTGAIQKLSVVFAFSIRTVNTEFGVISKSVWAGFQFCYVKIAQEVRFRSSIKTWSLRCSFAQFSVFVLFSVI